MAFFQSLLNLNLGLILTQGKYLATDLRGFGKAPKKILRAEIIVLISVFVLIRVYPRKSAAEWIEIERGSSPSPEITILQTLPGKG